MAGHANERRDVLSVRPETVEEEDIMANEGESDNGEVEGTVGDEAAERIKIPREEEVVRKFTDPLLPTKSEVDMHNVMGHIPFRNWCPICVKAQGRDWDHCRDSGKERKLPEYSWDYCFLGTSLGTSGPFLWGERESLRAGWHRRSLAKDWCMGISALTSV